MSHVLIFVALLYKSNNFFFFLICRVATFGLLDIMVLKGFGGCV